MTSNRPEEEKTTQIEYDSPKSFLDKNNATTRLLVTLGVIVIYFILTMMRLPGIDLGEGDPLSTIRIIGASSNGSLVELGILPILIAGLTMYILLKFNLYELDPEKQVERTRYNNVRMILSILITIILAFALTISGIYGTDLDIISQLAIIIQLTVVGILIVCLVELINRGWGYGSGISLILATGIGLRVMRAFLAPNNILEGPAEVTSARGIIWAVLYWTLELGPVKAFNYLFFRYSIDPTHNLNLPSLSLFSVYLAGIGFLVIVIMELLISRKRNQGHTHPKLEKLTSPVIPIVLITTTLAIVRFFSLFIWNMSGRDGSSSILTWILGDYRLELTTEQYVPIGGLAYFTTPLSTFMADLALDPIAAISHGVIYAAVFFGLYMMFSRINFWIANKNGGVSGIQKLGTQWLLIGITCVILDMFSVLGVGLGIIIFTLIIMDYYHLFTSDHSPEFIRFDLAQLDKEKTDRSQNIRISGGLFWVILVLFEVTLFIVSVFFQIFFN